MTERENPWKKAVYLRIHGGQNVSLVGSWKMCGPLIDNRTQQQDIGWHIFHALHSGAEKVEVVYDDQDADYKALYPPQSRRE